MTILLQSIILQTITAQNNKTSFKVEIKNSIGESQNEVFLKISGRNDIYKPDSCGIIKFEYEVPKSYKRTANIYLNKDKNNPVRSFTLDKENSNLFFTIDSKEDLLEFKKGNNTFYIEGIVTNQEGEPIEGAVVSIQGTGRYTLTDEIGLFTIDADYNHYIIIRADGMENMSLNVTPFLSNKDDAYTIKMKSKGENRVYTSVEKKPQYPGGMGSFKRYIDRNLKYPEKAKKDSIEGVVVMQFVVEKNGDITSPRIVRNLEPSLDSIAMKLVKNMPKWVPGSDHGTIVRCRYSVPISFKIPVPKPISTKKDSIVADSIRLLKDSINTDSIAIDSLRNDSLMKDSIIIGADSIKNDSIIAEADNSNVKTKKRNAFIRFFRWLFGIKDNDTNENNTSIENKQEKQSHEKHDIPVEEDKIKPDTIIREDE